VCWPARGRGRARSPSTSHLLSGSVSKGASERVRTSAPGFEARCSSAELRRQSWTFAGYAGGGSRTPTGWSPPASEAGASSLFRHARTRRRRLDCSAAALSVRRPIAAAAAAVEPPRDAPFGGSRARSPWRGGPAQATARAGAREGGACRARRLLSVGLRGTPPGRLGGAPPPRRPPRGPRNRNPNGRSASSTELLTYEEPPAGIEPAPRPYKGRVLAVDTTEARWRRRESNPLLLGASEALCHQSFIPGTDADGWSRTTTARGTAFTARGAHRMLSARLRGDRPGSNRYCEAHNLGCSPLTPGSPRLVRDGTRAEAGTTGLEPAASRLTSERSARLSYAPTR
jgi:hypothetical protein